jgi:hypothetical protein
MTESELDGLYGNFCRALSGAGEAHAPLLLARFALLAIEEINDAARVQALLARALTAGEIGLLAPRSSVSSPQL